VFHTSQKALLPELSSLLRIPNARETLSLHISGENYSPEKGYLIKEEFFK
jgi:hypothetical protein